MQQKWFVTGVAGFIGSHLLETLLRQGESVVGFDNFATGKQENLDDVRRSVGEVAWSKFRFVEGDIRDLQAVEAAVSRCSVVLHQAALGSVPRSIADPLTTNAVNVDGFLNVLVAAKNAGIRRIVYASSSSVYGDSPKLPKREDETGRPLSPYAVSKATNELYADAFARQFGLELVGLRYFNVFGPRQDPNGAYAAVVPRWVGLLLAGKQVEIFGDGETSRDFCYVQNVVAANLLAARERLLLDPPHMIANIACGDRTTLKELFSLILQESMKFRPSETEAAWRTPIFREERAGDVRHSLADLRRVESWISWKPTVRVAEGIAETVQWFAEQSRED